MNTNYRAIDIKMGPFPKGIANWPSFIYGWDIFINGVPFMKTLVLCNITVWILFRVFQK